MQCRVILSYCLYCQLCFHIHEKWLLNTSSAFLLKITLPPLLTREWDIVCQNCIISHWTWYYFFSVKIINIKLHNSYSYIFILHMSGFSPARWMDGMRSANPELAHRTELYPFLLSIIQAWGLILCVCASSPLPSIPNSIKFPSSWINQYYVELNLFKHFMEKPTLSATLNQTILPGIFVNPALITA